MNKKIPYIVVLLLLLLPSCSSKEAKQAGAGEEPIVKPKVIEHDKKKAAEQYKGTLFGNFNKKGGTTYEFASSNVLWRATLKTLDFIPLQSANYSGGVVVTDWYSSDISSDESIKIEVRFSSSELSPNSVNVISYKKKCAGQKCITKKLGSDFNQEIKFKILSSARKISLEDKAKEK